MPYHGKVLTDQEKMEVVKLYTGTPKLNIMKLCSKFRCGVQQITSAIDEAGIQRKRNKKREALGFNPKIKKHKLVTTVTKATPEYMDYIFTMMADAGRLDGDPVKNYERLIKESPFEGVKRTTVTKHRK